MIERLIIEEYVFKAILFELTETSFTKCCVSAKFPPEFWIRCLKWSIGEKSRFHSLTPVGMNRRRKLVLTPVNDNNAFKEITESIARMWHMAECSRRSGVFSLRVPLQSTAQFVKGTLAILG